MDQFAGGDASADRTFCSGADVVTGFSMKAVCQ